MDFDEKCKALIALIISIRKIPVGAKVENLQSAIGRLSGIDPKLAKKWERELETELEKTIQILRIKLIKAVNGQAPDFIWPPGIYPSLDSPIRANLRNTIAENLRGKTANEIAELIVAGEFNPAVVIDWRRINVDA